MTLVGMWGFDDSTGEVGAAYSTGTVSSPRGTVGAAWYSNNFSGTGVTCTFPTTIAAANTAYLGFGYRTNVWSTNYSMFGLFDNNSVMQLSIRSDASRRISLFRGDGATLLAGPSTYALPDNAWAFVEVKALVHATTGVFEVKVDGTVVATFTGNTQQAAFTTLNSVRVGATFSGGNAATFVDDLYVLDSTGSAPYNTYLGDVTVRTLLPTAAGDLTQWTPSTGANWDAVNEAAASSTDFVGTPTAGLKDLYNLADVPTTATVLAIQNWVYAAKSDAGVPPTTSLIAKGDGGTTRTDPPLTLSTTYQHLQGPIYTTDPDGDALTPTNVNAMQSGVST